jgi:two-component system response regulator (stage 0 sporulation protein F)
MRHHQAVAPVEEQRSSKTILVIENDEGIREVFRCALSQDLSYAPIIATTGKEAMTIITSMPVHLLLIDYHLANMNGVHFYDHLHAQAAFQHIPAIIMSTSLERHTQELVERNLVGLGKPFELDDLFEMVKIALGEQL